MIEVSSLSSENKESQDIQLNNDDVEKYQTAGQTASINSFEEIMDDLMNKSKENKKNKKNHEKKVSEIYDEKNLLNLKQFESPKIEDVDESRNFKHLY